MKNLSFTFIALLCVIMASCSKKETVAPKTPTQPTVAQSGNPAAIQSMGCNHVYMACLKGEMPGERCSSGAGGCRRMKNCKAFKYNEVELDDITLIGFIPTLTQIEAMAVDHAADNVTEEYIFLSEQSENENFARYQLLDFYY